MQYWCGNKVKLSLFSCLLLQYCKAHERKCESLLWCLWVPRLVWFFENALKWWEMGPCVIFSPLPYIIQLKWVFLKAYSVKLSSEFGLVLSRWLHTTLDYSLGFKPGSILRDAVWHFSLAYKRLPYIGPGLLSLCLPLHWPPAEQ